ncbi:MAG: polysaccharide deacetylase family protein [Acidimicrobiia bacterium]|nr:polysaccharide deacetylase family protein [Acidimicrobiia bacterium]
MAAETCDWPLGGAIGSIDRNAAGTLALPARRGKKVAAKGARVPLLALIVVGLVLGTASLAYGQAAVLSTGAERGVLASEPLDGSTALRLGSEPVDERESDELLDDLLDKLAVDEPELVEPTSERERESDAQAPTEANRQGQAAAPRGPGGAGPGVVHLTFDDGPHPTYTPAILDILARHDAKATFFVLGSLVETYPEPFARIVAEGHTVANHTWNHDDLAELSQAEFDDTVGRTQAALGRHATPCLRPPFGSVNANTRSWAAELGLELVLWHTDTLDWQEPGVDAIADSIVEGADGGSPILLHDAGGDRTQTIEALDQALGELSGRGLSFEPVC